ncbi:MAG: SGNH/GDSL hydrolase family protein [Candidatus Omnitrophota bacterium]
MSSSENSKSSPGTRFLLRAAKNVIIGFCVLLSLLLIVVLLQIAEMLQAAHLANNHSESVSLCREGGTFITCRMSMLRRSFPAVKEKGALRVFIVGSSQAMGTPYVHQKLNHISRFLPNEGGLATWLKDYLVFAMPKRRIEIINAAQGGSQMIDHLGTLREILTKGSPDIIVVMGGNNERYSGLHFVDSAAERDKRASVLYPAYQLTIQTMAQEVSAAGVKAIFVTLPSNLHDWLPKAPLDGGLLERLHKEITEEPYLRKEHRPVSKDSCRDLRSQWPQFRENPFAHFFLARCLESEGQIPQALAEFVAARDLDYQFLRVRSVQNESLRGLRGPGISILDLGTIMCGYAYNGIPGNDLFHDYCHMNLRGNKISGFEIAREILRLEGVPISDEKLRQAPLRKLNRRMLWWLYWLKTIKWSIQRFLPSSWQQLAVRGKTITDSYRQAMQDINRLDEQISLLQSENTLENGALFDGVSKT